MYWVNYITKNGTNIYSVSLHNGFINKEEALKEIDYLEKNNQLICLWIQKIENDKSCSIVLLRTYVDSFGIYKVSNFI